VTTIEALAAFAAALSPKADVDAAADAEMDAELAAMDAEEIERGAEVDEDAARAAAAEEKRKTDEKATALLQTLDCEATYPEFAEAIARCSVAAADARFGEDEEERSFAEKLSAFLVDGLKL